MHSTEPKKLTQFLARQLYDGFSDELHSEQLIEIENDRIAQIRSATAQETRDPQIRGFDLVAPGFIDLQINGAGDRQFNFEPNAQTLDRIARGARQGGTAYLLPTFITATGQDYQRAISATRDAILSGISGILGVHLEGPFLSHEKPGIHDPAAIRVMDEQDIDALASAKEVGIILLTVASENLPEGALARLNASGVRVFAGHTDATADQIAQAESEGLVGVTHLFNAMSQMTVREPGVVGATFASKALYAGIIADGHHVDWRNVGLAARLMPNRLCLVTDAMLTLAGEVKKFELHGEHIALENGRLTNAEGRLAGAHVSMIESVRNAIAHAGCSTVQALQMATANPARALGMETDVGMLRAGARASLTCLSQNLDVEAVMVNGIFPDEKPVKVI